MKRVYTNTGILAFYIWTKSLSTVELKKEKIRVHSCKMPIGILQLCTGLVKETTIQICIVSIPQTAVDLSDMRETINVLTNYIKKISAQKVKRKPKYFTCALRRLLMSYNNYMSKTNVLGFRFSEEDLRNQVENYTNLKITKSARGQVILFFITLQIISLIFLYFVDIGISFTDQLIGLILYAPVLFFTYKGHRWSIIGLMILWSFDKAYTIYYSVNMGSTPITSLVFLILGLSICSMALQVENERRKLSSTNK